MHIKFVNPKADKYFDYTASGLCVESIENEMLLLSMNYANTHSKEAGLSNHMNDLWYSARNSLFETLEINPMEFEIIPTGTGATAAIKKFQELIGIYLPPKTHKRCNIEIINKPLILIGPYEHHSNDISYRESIADTVRLKLNEYGEICLKDLENKLEMHKDKEIYVCVAVASNVTGIITDYVSISLLAKQYGAKLCLDAATSSPYMNVSSNFYDAMFLSPHKAIGGPGTTGLLIIKKDLVDVNLSPTFAGGGTVTYVNSETQYYDTNIHNRENAGTPSILQFIKTAKTYKLRNDFGLGNIKKIKKELYQYFISELSTLPDVTIYGNQNLENIGICSFNIEGFSPYKLCHELSYKYNIETRAGCSCAGPYGHELLGLDNDFNNKNDVGWLRVSIHFTHNKYNIDYLIDSLKQIIKKD